MKKYILFFMLALGLHQITNAKFYSVIGKIHKLKGEPCYFVEVQLYDDNNTPTPKDDVYLGNVWTRVCPPNKGGKHNNKVESVYHQSYGKISNESFKITEINIYPSPISRNEKLNVDFGDNEFDYLSITPANDVELKQSNFIFFEEKTYKGKITVDITNLEPGSYVLNAVSSKNKIFASKKFIVK